MSAVTSTTLDVEYSDITNVGASTINITDIEWNKPDSIEVTGGLTYIEFSSSRTYVYWDATSIPAKESLTGTYTSGEDGTFTLSDLPIIGIYRLVETKTVEDYLLPSGQWKIEFDYGNLTDDEAVIDYNGQGVKITAIGNPPALSLQTVSTDDTETDILYLYNSSSYDVPTTGSFETNNFYWIGIPITLLGVFIIITRKRLEYATGKFSSLRNSVNEARRIIDNWDKNS